MGIKETAILVLQDLYSVAFCKPTANGHSPAQPKASATESKHHTLKNHRPRSSAKAALYWFPPTALFAIIPSKTLGVFLNSQIVNWRFPPHARV